MGNIGAGEILVVLVIALIVLGPQRLPEVARSVGRGMREFREAISSGIHLGDDEDDEPGDDLDEPERRLPERG
jgi:sec-independent protein translocase protein TatA